jgi:hypothetical protein
MPNDGTDFVTIELWDVLNDGISGAQYWTEVGVVSGLGYYHNWFWADNRPNGGGYHAHVQSSEATGGPLPVETTYVGNNQWDIYGGNSFTQIGTSTSNPDSGSGRSQFGTEYTVNPGTSMRDLGGVYQLEYESQAGQWYGEYSLAKNHNYGTPPPNVPWINGSYNASGDYETWGGIC